LILQNQFLFARTGSIVAHIDPKRTGNAGAIDEIPHDSDQAWQAKASDAL
jgi:hypothetical protein